MQIDKDHLALKDKVTQLEDQRFELLLDNIKDYSIIMMDEFGLIVSWNRGAEEITGYRKEEILGKHFSIFYPIVDIEEGTPFANLLQVKSEGRLEVVGWRCRKDGSLFWASVVFNAIHNEDGNIIGFSKVTRDITEKKRIEDLEDSIRMRDEFISVASHELRTPLTIILLNLQMMKKNGELPSERMMKSLDVSENAAKELVSIMDNLVDVTRLRLGKLEMKRTKTNIKNVLLNVLTKFKDEIRLNGINVSVQHEGEIIGYWDQSRLEQLFTNLLSNSIKYGQGSPVKLVLKLQGEFVSFDITDEGPGIPLHLQGKIFERFERAVGSKNISGLGLGLYISRQIVDAHLGEISVVSQPGHGAQFSFKIPLKQGR